MTVATNRFTFDEYLHYEDGADTRYELVNGELVPMSLGSGLHGEIMHFLERSFEQTIQQQALPWVARKGVIGVRSPQRGRWDTSRIPDVTVLPLEQWRLLRNRESVIELTDPPPLLVVEVVSESTKSVDYRAKRSEYGVLGIPEYWIVDPLEQKITLCVLIEGFYDALTVSGAQTMASTTFPTLDLTAEKILNPDT
ncbi:Uma2 family endonuclease [Pseudanabaena sp. FACHB-2040]|uniref:Uma2 family endonuclease n=1 Tax=Pseudanabaena sp. FACHB-2040 TaxID=2692859 RepID=UPI00168A0CD1|nr:Uma2 family endonuclease [Pseudanabaena sp. FACHB-2040]MBD2260121.1 Uma2 family endonuclease [Pseudanabaena sp. FACHB-2040]